MTDNYREERINRLLHELKYEITRGIMERDIPVDMTFRYHFPFGNKTVLIEMTSREIEIWEAERKPVPVQMVRFVPKDDL